MARIVLATFGSLGDLHPMLALAIELRRRGHEIVINTLEVYREKIDTLGFEFFSMRPNVHPEDDRELAREIMDAKKGSEKLLREILLPNIRPMYEDLTKAVAGADLLVSGEVVFAAKPVAEKTGIKWVSTSLAPASFLSAHDPFLPPTAPWLKHFRFLPAGFHRMIFGLARRMVHNWSGDFRAFRRELGLEENSNPLFDGKFSERLHLALFSKILGKTQPDWHSPTLQCGFCFYDGQQDLGKMPEGLQEFLDAGEPPVIFTLGSAAVMDARDFFEQSAEAARILQRRAVLLYGIFNEPPKTTLDAGVVAFDYAPYSLVFPRAAGVVHQGGVGTTAQVLRAGVPHLFMPYSHDQPDNAARCERAGVARVISRDDYKAQNAADELRKLLSDSSYKSNAIEAKRIVDAERGTQMACDAIEEMLK
ncbi:MAG TPA: glycosyltransferase [Pyrinomonadaceae bacterium]|jgi:UDP:flavonoid glycosyltransferase YjiC (YdhE family)